MVTAHHAFILPWLKVWEKSEVGRRWELSPYNSEPTGSEHWVQQGKLQTPSDEVEESSTEWKKISHYQDKTRTNHQLGKAREKSI